MAKKNGNSVVNLGNASTDFYMKITGANLGSKIAAGTTKPIGGSGGGIIDAAKGAAKIRKIMKGK